MILGGRVHLFYTDALGHLADIQNMNVRVSESAEAAAQYLAHRQFKVARFYWFSAKQVPL